METYEKLEMAIIAFEQDDVITDPEIYTDSLDTDSIESLLKTMPGKRISEIIPTNQIEDDIISLLSEDEL